MRYIKKTGLLILAMFMYLFESILKFNFVLGMIQADRVYGSMSATETTEAKIGSITVPTSGVTRIVGVYGRVFQPTATAGELISAHFRLAFTTVSGRFKFPTVNVGGAAGTLASPQAQNSPVIIPVDIPVPANETIDCYATADVALTGTAAAEIGVLFA